MSAGILGVLLGLVLVMRGRETAGATRSAVARETGERVASTSTERDPLV